MLSTGEIYVALRERYRGNAWAFLTEVPDGTGSAKCRSADAMAMSLWPSRGLELNGFEVKVSRSDWLRELKSPEKAESICCYCDRWWLVVGDERIVKDGELPATWGLLVPRGKGVIQRKEAPVLKPEPVDRVFLAALLRRAMEQLVPDDQLEVIKRQEYDRGRQFSADNRAEKELKELQQRVALFEKTSGIEISRWNSQQVAETLRTISDCDRRTHLLTELKRLLDRERGYVQLVERAVKGIEDLDVAKLEAAKVVPA